MLPTPFSTANRLKINGGASMSSCAIALMILLHMPTLERPVAPQRMAKISKMGTDVLRPQRRRQESEAVRQQMTRTERMGRWSDR